MLESLGLAPLVALFLISASGVVGAGIILARHGDAIAVHTGLGGLLVGMLLMAGATSLPEIVTEVSAAAAGAPDLAIGDLLGSSMANMAILAVIDLLRRRAVWPSVGLGHARVASIAMVLTVLLLLGIVNPGTARLGWIGLEPLVIVAVYVAAVAWIHRAGRTRRDEAEPEVAAEEGELLTPLGWGEEGPPHRLRHHVIRFAASAGIVLLAAPVVAVSAQGIAEETGLAQTFIGATLLAVVTSLPELVASVAAVQLGAYDLAVGNLFGSNAFNATIVVFADAAYLPGPILGAVSDAHLLTGLGALLLMAIAVAGIVHGARTRVERGEPDALLLLGSYVVLLWILSSA